VTDPLPLVLGFVSFLLLPALGVAGLFRQRITPVLSALLFAWLLGGVWALSSGWRAGLPEERFLRLWLVGLVLGGGLLFIAKVREKRRTWKWVRLVLGAMTVIVFVRALLAYVRTFS